LGLYPVAETDTKAQDAPAMLDQGGSASQDHLTNFGLGHESLKVALSCMEVSR